MTIEGSPSIGPGCDAHPGVYSRSEHLAATITLQDRLVDHPPGAASGWPELDNALHREQGWHQEGPLIDRLGEELLIEVVTVLDGIHAGIECILDALPADCVRRNSFPGVIDRKSTRLNSSH